MEYFGGGGVQGNLHPSLQAYVDCFDSAPFPRAWPRGGGIWDQDPILVRDFREIRSFEIQWKRTQETLARANGQQDLTGLEDAGPSSDLDSMLDEFIEQMDDEAY